MYLQFLPPGCRFHVIDSDPPITGTLVHASECRALVILDGKPTIRDFETADHEWVRIQSSGQRRTSIAPGTEVFAIR